MRPRLLLVVAVGIAPYLAHAEGQIAQPIQANAEVAVPDELPPAIGFATHAGESAKQDSSAVTTTLNSAFNFESPPAEGIAESAPPSQAIEGRPLHPVCDCNCRISSLDCWCAYDLRCGTTEGPPGHPCESAVGKTYLMEDGTWMADDACCDVWGSPIYGPNTAVRFGWWAVSSDGSEVKTGEFQDLNSSPFWDVDFISSNGRHTLDVVLSGLDNEANDARVRYFGPSSSGRLDFQRYFRRLDHDPLAGLDLAPGQVPPPTPEGDVIVEDLNVGEDYAIRVEELDARYQGRINENLKWRLNLWGQRKFGERQANATAHCFNVLADAPPGATGNVCHVLSQRQSIDWLTMEMQPAVEASFDNVAVEYSRTMRTFDEDDGNVFRRYTRFDFQLPAANGFLGPEYEYAIVPESVTQIDRLKISARLNDDNQFYANLYIGATENKFRNFDRDYDGYDLRLINRSLDDVTVTYYASRYDETNELPTVFFNQPPLGPPTPVDQNSVRHPIDYRRTRAGVKSTWQPFGDRGPRCSNYGLWDGTSLASGYEYYQLERDFVTWNVNPVPFTQPNTRSHQIEFGPSTKWSRAFDTFTRYKVRFIDDPLIGVSERAEDDPAALGTFNTKLPEEEHIVELGGTWMPTRNFMTTAQFNIVDRRHESEFANFEENDYPILFTTWYAPTHRLSFTGGYAYFSNWIDQDITLGANRGDPTEIETTRWDYAGENHLFNVGANYAWTSNVQLICGYEFNRGSNTFDIPVSPHVANGVDWTTVEQVADVIVETHRLTAGVDWQPTCDMNVYLRYIYFDYGDISADLDSGTAHMVLAGATRTW